MAWYLSEVVTDLSPISEILRLYDQTEPYPEEVLHDEYQSRLIPLLHQATFNADHIDTDTIPPAYENDEYKWLASGYHDLIVKLGLVKLNVEERSNEHSLELTDIGTQIINLAVAMPELMKIKLPEWKNDLGVQPYPEIINIVSKLKQRNLYPCDGLLLLEVLIILLWLNKPYGHINPYEQIYRKRREYYPHMVGEPRIDLIQYSGFLWEQMSQDLSNYYAANYPARATLQLMMYAGELSYGPVPDEIFGLVQYITIG
ncbi:MAG: hypothetical protein KZQ96_19740 [Candidatus Thiodiazotropha sp. (ex Lucinoma borealis)]|nr:hypothetical protein [Candidatus Thiodiazotropha sp. (ex Lucinoma borealis)]